MLFLISQPVPVYSARLLPSGQIEVGEETQHCKEGTWTSFSSLGWSVLKTFVTSIRYNPLVDSQSVSSYIAPDLLIAACITLFCKLYSTDMTINRASS